ncbi:hypothetical protein [Mucilaginibacter sp.]
MKKLIFLLAISFSTLAFSSCTKEDVKPTGEKSDLGTIQAEKSDLGTIQ